jgi:hypothetical protein
MQIGRQDVLWNYAAIFLQIAAQVLLFPFILRTLPRETVAVWMIFSTIIALVNLLDFGFNPSFARNVTYVFSGAKILKPTGFDIVEENAEVDYGLLKGLIGAMRRFYSRMTIVFLLSLLTLGTYYLYTILKTYRENHIEVYTAWVLLCVINAYSFELVAKPTGFCNKPLRFFALRAAKPRFSAVAVVKLKFCNSLSSKLPLRVILAVISSLSLTMCEVDISPEKPAGGAYHIVFIGLDGWGAYSVSNADIPVIKRMMREGSYTLKARCVLPSFSAPNWASLFMGSGPEIHGYTLWNSETPELPPLAADRYGFTPTIFSVLKEQMPESRIDFFYEWPGLGYLVPHDVFDSIQQIPGLSNSDEPVDVIANHIKQQKPTLTSIIFDDPDHTGHEFGFQSSEYCQKLSELDRYIGLIEQAVKDAGMYDDTVFILSADHGGVGTSHGGKTMLEMEIPLIFYGKNIRKGFEITRPIMIYDITATIAALFNLSLPYVWTGRPVYSVLDNN